MSGEEEKAFEKIFGHEKVEAIEIGSIDAVRVPFKMVREALGDEANEIDRALFELFLDDPLDDLKATAKRLGYDGTERDGVIDVARMLNGGPAQNRDDAVDLSGSLLFAARALARLDRKVRAARKVGDTKRAIILAFQMGRLAEWWRWRKTGLDKKARTRKRADRTIGHDNPGRAIWNARRKAEAQAWHEQARAIADGSKLTGEACYQRVQRQLRKLGINRSVSTIRKALSGRS